MTTAEQVETAPTQRRMSAYVSRGLILIVGVFGVPLLLMLLFTSYHTVTVDSALRQAFASVAGQTVAIATALTVVAMTAVTRRWRQLPLFIVIAVFVCVAAVNSMTSTGEQLWWLLQGLG